jgi:hypothetical protein
MDDLRRKFEMQALMEQMEPGDRVIPKVGPATALVGAMNHARRTGSISGFIEEMEAEGQKQLAQSAGARLPAEGTLRARHGELFDWSAWGVEIGEPVEGDDIWVEAKIPAGWSVTPTDHSMWSELRDQDGRVRASIFYKAAFYDRSCFIRVERRYEARVVPVNENDHSLEAAQWATACDGGKEIDRLGPFRSTPEPEGATWEQRKDWCAYDMAEAAGLAYLNEHFPEHADPAAYWESGHGQSDPKHGSNTVSDGDPCKTPR